MTPTREQIAASEAEEREAAAFVEAQWKVADEWIAAEWPHATDSEKAMARSLCTELARRAADAQLHRVLDHADSFCPKCGHNRDASSVSSVHLGVDRRACQMCGTEWQEFIDGMPAAALTAALEFLPFPQFQPPGGKDLLVITTSKVFRKGDLYGGKQWRIEGDPGWNGKHYEHALKSLSDVIYWAELPDPVALVNDARGLPDTAKTSDQPRGENRGQDHQ